MKDIGASYGWQANLRSLMQAEVAPRSLVRPHHLARRVFAQRQDNCFGDSQGPFRRPYLYVAQHNAVVGASRIRESHGVADVRSQVERVIERGRAGHVDRGGSQNVQASGAAVLVQEEVRQRRGSRESGCGIVASGISRVARWSRQNGAAASHVSSTCEENRSPSYLDRALGHLQSADTVHRAPSPASHRRVPARETSGSTADQAPRARCRLEPGVLHSWRGTGRRFTQLASDGGHLDGGLLWSGRGKSALLARQVSLGHRLHSQHRRRGARGVAGANGKAPQRRYLWSTFSAIRRVSRNFLSIAIKSLLAVGVTVITWLTVCLPATTQTRTRPARLPVTSARAGAAGS